MNKAALIVTIAGFSGLFYLLMNMIERKKREKLVADVVSGKRKQKPTHYDLSVEWDENGFTIRNDKSPEVVQVLWPEIVNVTAFKRDLFSVDLICLFFEKRDKTGIEIHEETNHWQQFVEALPAHLPGCDPLNSWFASVATPAFAPNPTKIFERNTSS